jgi:hypothetical protein
MIPSRRGLGLLLILFGILLLADQFLDLNLGQWAWPFYVLVPGLLLYGTALAVGGTAGTPLAIVGSIVTAVGAVLFVQNATGLWATWSYAWALVAPTGIGLGLALYGALRGTPKQVNEGLEMAGIGIVLFLVFGAIFELIIGISGLRLGVTGIVWPALLILVGLILLLRNVVHAFRR